MLVKSKEIPKKVFTESDISATFAALRRYEDEKKLFHCSVWKSNSRYFIWQDILY